MPAESLDLYRILLNYSFNKPELTYSILNQWLKHPARLYLPVYQYESDKMKIVYAGYSSIKKNYYVRLLLDRDNQPTYLGRYFYWKIPDLIESCNLDMAISEISMINLNHFHNCNGFILPEWATMRINIDRPICEICQRKVSDFSDVIRLIRKYNLTYEILSDKKSYNYFNDKIFLPYITKRHGEEAVIENLNLLWRSSPSPLLMAIKEDGTIVGASLI